VGPHLHDPARPPGDDAGAEPGPLPEANPEAVLDAERLLLDALVVPGDAAVGEHTIHVEQQQLHGGKATVEVRGIGHAMAGG
jgi:hypothetical protein